MEPSDQVQQPPATIDYNLAYRELKQQQPLSDPRAVLGITFPDWREYFSENIDEKVVKEFIETELIIIQDIFGLGEIAQTEHVGSTSIPGMCGMLLPDIILYVKQFPPTNQVFQKLVSAGFDWLGLSPHLLRKDDDLFFSKRNFTAPRDRKTMMGLILHVVPQDFKALDPLIKFRDLARTNNGIRDDYRNAKLDVFHNRTAADSQTFLKYKMEKSKEFQQTILSTANFAAKAPEYCSELKQFQMPQP